MVRIVARQGESRWLVECGDPELRGDRTARVYDGRRGTLSTPLPRDSILARGYWTQGGTADERASVEEAVRARIGA